MLPNTGGVNWRAVIGYGPLIIEFADAMTNGVVLALTGACDFYKASWTESQHFCCYTTYAGLKSVLFFQAIFSAHLQCGRSWISSWSKVSLSWGHLHCCRNWNPPWEPPCRFAVLWNESNWVRVHVGETVSKPVWESVTPPCWVFLQCEASRERKATVCCVCTVWDGLLLLTCMWSTVP